jgi:hypothetical protein
MALKLLKKKTYLSMIENSAKGENWTFRNLWAEINGKEVDILDNGQLSCAVFVSSILYLNKLIGDIHANVGSIEKSMLKSGWREIKELRPGAVLIWENKKFEDGIHGHIGFYIGGDVAISNSSFEKGFPVRHHHTYKDTRKIEKIYWHSFLD